MTAHLISSSAPWIRFSKLREALDCDEEISFLFAKHKPFFSRPISQNSPFVVPVKNKLAARLWKMEGIQSVSAFVAFAVLFARKHLLSPSHVFTECVSHPLTDEIDEISQDTLEVMPSPPTRKRPTLSPPSMFVMVFEANKTMTAMNQKKMMDCKREMEVLEEKRAKVRSEKLEQWNKQRDKSKAAANWSTAMAVFSWISCCLEILSGIALIAMGNVVGGGLLLAGGLIQLTSHIMMQTGGWDKVAELLPGDNPEEKKKIISWMQIGIAIFSMMLAGAGGTMVGMSGLSPAMRVASSLAISGLAIGQGIVTIGQGVSHSEVKEAQSILEKLNAHIQKYDYRQQDIRERMEEGLKFDKRCTDMIAQAIKQQNQIHASLFRPINT